MDKTATFEIFQSASNKRWYYNLLAANQEPILRTAESDGFADVAEATIAIDDLRTAVKTHQGGKQTIERFDGGERDFKDQKLYFRVVSEDGDKLAVSEGYNSGGARAKGIDSVLLNAPKAGISIVQELR